MRIKIAYVSNQGKSLVSFRLTTAVEFYVLRFLDLQISETKNTSYETRTRDTSFKRRKLWPTELRRHAIHVQRGNALTFACAKKWFQRDLNPCGSEIQLSLSQSPWTRLGHETLVCLSSWLLMTCLTFLLGITTVFAKFVWVIYFGRSLVLKTWLASLHLTHHSCHAIDTLDL